MTVEQAAAMETPETPATEEASPKIGQGSEEVAKPAAPEAKPPTIEELSQRLTQVEAEKAELQNFAKGAVTRAERADEYVARMTESLRDAASRVGNRQEGGPTLDERFRDDPLSVMDAHYQARTGPIVESVTKTQAAISQQIAENQWKAEKVPGTDKTVYDVYGKELNEFMGKLPDATRADAGAYAAALRWVRSHHIDDEIKMRTEAQATREQRGFVESPGVHGDRKAPAKALNEIERQVAKGLGMPDDEYMKWRDGGAEA